MTAAASKVDRDSFRIFRTRDGRYLVESPHILKNAKPGEEVRDMLVVNKDGVTVQGRALIAKELFLSV